MSHKLRLFAFASLLVNVLLAGIILGHMLRLPGPPPPPLGLEALSPDKREMVESALAKARGEGSAQRAAFREAREESVRLLAMEPFDRRAYLAHMQKMEALSAERRARMAETIADLAPKLDVKDRKILGNMLRKPGPPPPPPPPSPSVPPEVGDAP